MNKQTKNIAIISAFVLTVILIIGLVMAAPLFKGKPQCKDGIDNDGDGLIDYPKDPGCASLEDRDEYNTPVCSDECSPAGKKQCFENYVITCGNFDSDSCLEWDTLGTYCIYGCSNGVCNNPPPANESVCGNSVCESDETCDNCASDCGQCPPVNTCTDTDGFNLYLQGTVSGLLNGEAYSYTDYCVDSIQLEEYYCAGSNYYSYATNCAQNQSMTCINGACQ